MKTLSLTSKMILLITSLFFIFFTSCSNDESINNEVVVKVDNSNLKRLLSEATTNLKGRVELDSELMLRTSALNDIEAETILLPVISETRLMLNQYGISDNEIIEDYGDLESPELIYVGIYLANDNNNTTFGFDSGQVIDCILRATGISAFHDAFWGSFSNKRMLLRAVGKLATRTLGWVGAALIVADFADCMWN